MKTATTGVTGDLALVDVVEDVLKPICYIKNNITFDLNKNELLEECQNYAKD